jgi:succinoglycan biosynthesis transport protein ExoP
MPESPKTAFETYLQVFVRRKFTFLGVFVVALAGMGLLTFAVKPQYSSTSRVAVAEPNMVRTPDFMDVYLPGASALTLSGDTYVALIKGLPMAERVSDKLAGEGISVSGKRVAQCVGAEFYEPDMIEITATVPDSLRAVALANAMAETFVEENRDAIRRELSRATDFIEREIVVAQDEWLAAQQDLAAFRARERVANMDNWMGSKMEEIAANQHLVAEKEAALSSNQARLNEVRTLLKPNAVTSLNPREDPVLQGLQTRLVEVETDLAAARGEYAEGHQAVRGAEAKRDRLLAEIRARTEEVLRTPEPVSDPIYYQELRRNLVDLEVGRIGLETELGSLKSQLQQSEDEMNWIPGKVLAYRQLTLQVYAAEQKYSKMLEQLHLARIQVGGVQGNASVIDLAVDSLPTTTQSRLLLYAFVLSLLLGVGAVFVMEYLDDTLRTTEEMSREVQLTPLGVVPRVRAVDRRLLSPDDQRSPLFETYRILRSGVRFAAVNNPIRNLLVTSAVAGEGKSSTVVNLGVVMAAGGQRVLLVDADMRNPTLHRLLGVEPAVGLTSVLLGESSLEEAILSTPYERLRFLPCGPVPPNPVELFESQGMKELVGALRAYADLVIFDSAPTLPVTDAALLAGALDAVILVLAAGEVTTEDSRSSKRILENAGARVIGGILNKVRGVSPDGYYGRYPHREDPGRGLNAGRGRLSRAVNGLTARLGGRGE